MLKRFWDLVWVLCAEDGVYEKLVSRQLQKQANVITTTSSSHKHKELDIDTLMDEK